VTSDVVVDSCVAAKWVISEADSAQADRLMHEVPAKGGRLLGLDFAFNEVANAIWKRFHRRLMTSAEADKALADFLATPLQVQSSTPLLKRALGIAMQFDRALYDAAFVALVEHLSVQGVTSDEPLHKAVHSAFPQIILLRDW
jgi:predicted nucleic acid-binding protein